MKISIPTPCSEDLGQMSPTQRGFFCDKCEKEVVDFRPKSTYEIKQTLLEYSRKNVCGTIYQNQMDDFNLDTEKIIRVFRIHPSRLKMFAMIVVLGTTLFSCQYENPVEDLHKVGTIILRDSTENNVEYDDRNTFEDSIPYQKTGKIIPSKKQIDIPVEIQGEIMEKPDTNKSCVQNLADVTVEADEKITEKLIVK